VQCRQAITERNGGDRIRHSRDRATFPGIPEDISMGSHLGGGFVIRDGEVVPDGSGRQRRKRGKNKESAVVVSYLSESI
jgi:hypothetical protein